MTRETDAQFNDAVDHFLDLLARLIAAEHLRAHSERESQSSGSVEKVEPARLEVKQ
jgi:hypothetical protein